MTWTSSKPTVPGWYWHKGVSSDQIRCLQLVQNGSWLGYWYGDNRLFFTLPKDGDRGDTGHWAGPLTPPSTDGKER